MWAEPFVSIAINHFQIAALWRSFSLEFEYNWLYNWWYKLASIDVVSYASFECIANFSYGERWWLHASLPLALVSMVALAALCHRVGREDDAAVPPLGSECVDVGKEGGAPPTTIRDGNAPSLLQMQSFDEEEITELRETDSSDHSDLPWQSKASPIDDVVQEGTDDDEQKDRERKAKAAVEAAEAKYKFGRRPSKISSSSS